jgi:Ser/Thr protein kinase RdoA (MazF antagonist)
MNQPDIGEPRPRPYVDTAVHDLDSATEAARSAARMFGAGQVQLLRMGMNAVFAADLGVLRVSHPSVPAEASLALARRLAEAAIRVPSPLDDRVHRTDGFSVTWWERVVPADSPIDWRGVGGAVATLHGLARADLPVSYPCPPPASFPWWDFDAMLAAVADHLDPTARSALVRVIERHSWWRETPAATVVCHGDVHPGNVIQAAEGPVLLDWDLLCEAPAGWDHGPMMRWAERWGGAPGEYEAFAAGYGQSFRGDPFAEAVADLRLVAATLMRMRRGLTDQAVADEAERRLRWWRGDPDAPVWRAQ